MSRKNKHRERVWLFNEQQGKCYWCGVQMVMPEHIKHQTMLPNTATIDHLFSRLSPDRGKIKGKGHVLACSECNHKRGQLEDLSLPLDERRIRSGRYVDPNRR